MKPLDIYSDLSEQVKYNWTDLYLYIKTDHLSRYGYAADCHWHLDLEFIYILDGTMDFYVNGKIVSMISGQGLFINSKRLHYGFSSEKKECHFIALVVHPSVLHQNISSIKSYYGSKFSFQTEDLILLKKEIVWQNEIITLIQKSQNEMISQNKNPFHLLAYTQMIVANISEHIQENPVPKSTPEIMDSTVWKMLVYIHQNYMNDIKIDDIAAVANVCRSNCCKQFHDVVKETPNSYLKHYRIMKSCQLLRDTNRSISEIADSCGFQSVSYFVSVFRKSMKISPAKYRKQENND